MNRSSDRRNENKKPNVAFVTKDRKTDKSRYFCNKSICVEHLHVCISDLEIHLLLHYDFFFMLMNFVKINISSLILGVVIVKFSKHATFISIE